MTALVVGVLRLPSIFEFHSPNNADNYIDLIDRWIQILRFMRQLRLLGQLGAMSRNYTVLGADAGTWHYTIDITIAAPLERVWEIASNWLHFPANCSMECTEGENGVPGCVRKVSPTGSSHYWVAEKLTHIDHAQHILVYDLVGGNTNIQPGYQAAFQVNNV